jgi:hypothetical protein
LAIRAKFGEKRHVLEIAAGKATNLRKGFIEIAG